MNESYRLCPEWRIVILAYALQWGMDSACRKYGYNKSTLYRWKGLVKW